MVWDHPTYVPTNTRSFGPSLEDEGSSEPDTSGGFWDWWRRNGDGATDILNAGLCSINPRRAGCPGSRNYPPAGNANDPNNQTVLYLIVGLVVLMLFILILRK